MTAPTVIRVGINADDEHQGQQTADQPTSHLLLLSSHLPEQLLAHGLGISEPLSIIGLQVAVGRGATAMPEPIWHHTATCHEICTVERDRLIPLVMPHHPQRETQQRKQHGSIDGMNYEHPFR
jgi:hypothetical protein